MHYHENIKPPTSGHRLPSWFDPGTRHSRPEYHSFRRLKPTVECKFYCRRIIKHLKIFKIMAFLPMILNGN